MFFFIKIQNNLRQQPCEDAQPAFPGYSQVYIVLYSLCSHNLSTPRAYVNPSQWREMYTSETQQYYI